MSIPIPILKPLFRILMRTPVIPAGAITHVSGFIQMFTLMRNLKLMSKFWIVTKIIKDGVIG